MKRSPCLRASLAVLIALTLTAARGAPERNHRRWPSDVRERLRILEVHGADAECERVRASIRNDSRGRSAPQPPAAGDGSVR